MKRLYSEVEGFEGPCKAVWLNRNLVWNRIDGGVTGFFKNIKPVKFGPFKFYKKYGEEFHGIITDGGMVKTTRGCY